MNIWLLKDKDNFIQLIKRINKANLLEIKMANIRKRKYFMVWGLN